MYWTIVKFAMLSNFLQPVLSALDESTVPGPPENVQVTTSSEEIVISWDPPHNADKVLVRGYTLSYGVGTPHIKTVIEGAHSNTYTVSFLEPNTTYAITLTAYNDAAGEDSEMVMKTVTTEPTNKKAGVIFNLFAPNNVQAKVLSPTAVELTWEDPGVSENALPEPTQGRHYLIQYSTYPNPSGSYETLKCSELSAKIYGLQPNTDYEFAVKTVSDEGSSAWSLRELIRTDSASPSTAPYGFRLMSKSPGQVKISWMPPREPNGPLLGYEIRYTVGDDRLPIEQWNKEVISGNVTIYTLQDVPPGMLYVRIRATNGMGAGPFSPMAIHSVEPAYEVTTPEGMDEKNAISLAVITAEGEKRIPLDDNKVAIDAGGMMTVSCAISSRHHLGDRLLWSFGNGTEITRDYRNSRIYAKGPKSRLRSHLIFGNLKKEDAGVYWCRASIDGHSVDRSFVLKVSKKPHAAKPDYPSYSCTFESKSACGFDADLVGQPPAVTWDRSAVSQPGQHPGLELHTDHTSLNMEDGRSAEIDAADHVMYLRRELGKGTLTSPQYPPTNFLHYCASVWFFVQPGSQGSLSMSTVENLSFNGGERTVFSTDVGMPSMQGEWRKADAQLPPMDSHYKVKITAHNAYGKQLTMAVDDFELKPGFCDDADRSYSAKNLEPHSETDVDLLDPVEKALNGDPRIFRAKGQEGLPAVGLKRGASVVVPYRMYLPKRFFRNFAILVSVKPTDPQGGYLFAVLNAFDTVVNVGVLLESAGGSQTNLTLLYTDPRTEQSSQILATFLVPDMTNHWTQFAFEVNNDKVTLFYKCMRFATREVQRRPKQLVLDDPTKLYIGSAGPIMGGNFEVDF